MNKAQNFLLNKGYNDLVITHPTIVDPEKWTYVSEAMMEFHRNLTSKSNGREYSCSCSAVKRIGVGKFCPDCGGRNSRR